MVRDFLSRFREVAKGGWNEAATDTGAGRAIGLGAERKRRVIYGEADGQPAPPKER